MSRVSPTAEGFRTAFRWPSVTVAEITWRWVVGATATALFFFGFFEYLNSLPVNRGELLFLRTRQPYLVAQAVLHILRGSFRRAALAAIVAALLMLVFWIMAGSVGRIATLRAIIGHIRARISASVVAGGIDSSCHPYSQGATLSGPGNPFTTLVAINFFRIAAVLAAVFGLFGAGILASFASPAANPHRAIAFLLFLPFAALIAFVWAALNWLLSLAAIFVVRDGLDAVAAISAAVSLCRERTGAVFAVSSWVGLAHLVVFVAATTVVSVPLGFVPLVPGRLVVLAMLLSTLAYFAVADWLYMARLAGYVCIAEMPEALLHPIPPILPAPPSPIQTTIDRDELILSDVPTLILET